MVAKNNALISIAIAVLIIGGFSGAVGSLWFANTIPGHKAFITLSLVVAELYCAFMYFKTIGVPSYIYRALCIIGIIFSVALSGYALFQYHDISWFVLIFRTFETISFLLLLYVNFQYLGSE